jgi:hypothetical protein
MIFALLLFSGCAEKVIYRDVPVEVSVPNKCEVPKTSCDFNKDSYTEVVVSLRTCIEDLKESIKVCQ